MIIQFLVWAWRLLAAAVILAAMTALGLSQSGFCVSSLHRLSDAELTAIALREELTYLQTHTSPRITLKDFRIQQSRIVRRSDETIDLLAIILPPIAEVYLRYEVSKKEHVFPSHSFVAIHPCGDVVEASRRSLK